MSRVEQLLEAQVSNSCGPYYGDSYYHDAYHDYEDSLYHDDYIDTRYDDRYTDGIRGL